MLDGALIDTSFFIRFLKESDPLFEKADRYYKYFLEKEYRMVISTISIAEYCVKGAIQELPLKNLVVLPFNINHAQKAGEFAKVLYESRNKKELLVPERKIIINDAKLFAQAESELHIKHFVTSDTECLKLFETLKKKISLNFNIIDINKSCQETFGLLEL